MVLITVPGENKRHEVLVYALSTCAWCRRTKDFLKRNGIEYTYIDVDHCSEEDREKVEKDILKRGGGLTFPAIIIDNKILINGFKEEKLKEALTP